jgi:putative alpha-1,2-mannosidase
MAQSQLNYYAENGLLQQWGYLNLDNYVMVGDPEDSIIADAYAFGAKNFDTQTALADMIKQATTNNDVRPEASLLKKYGYIPQDGSYGCCNAHGFVSTLLEFDSEDFALSRFASSLGDKTDASRFQKMANDWVNIFDTSNDLLTGGPRTAPSRPASPRSPGATATRRTTSRATPTSTCGTCRTTTPACSPCSAAIRRSYRS